MRIVLDFQCCQSGSRLGGIGRYSLELAKAMIKQAPDDEFIVILNDRNPEAIRAVQGDLRDVLRPDNIRVFSVPTNCQYYDDEGKTSSAAELIRDEYISIIDPDFIHVTSLFEGLMEPIVTSINSSGHHIPTAVTLYDLIPMVQEDLYLKSPIARDYYFAKFDQLKKADALLAISDFSAREGLELIGDYEGVVADIRGGIDEKFKVLPNQKEALAKFLKRKGIKDNFLMYTASFDQRKNQSRLIEAFAGLPRHIRQRYQLVIVGQGWQEIYENLKGIATAAGLGSSDVIFTGRVSDEELIGLYNLCKLFVFPSLWEGLGLPVLEAMACGAPVIGSNTTSLPEVLGWDKATFDPTSVESMTTKIAEALTNKQFYTELKAHGAKHHKEFTWAESARRALVAIREAHSRVGQIKAQSFDGARPREALKALLDKDRYSDRQVWEFACCLSANQLNANSSTTSRPPVKLGWVTSWGVRCGIASYSANLLRHIAQETVVLASRTPRPMGEDAGNVIRCWDEGKSGELEELSAAIEQFSITDIVIQFNYGFYNFEALSKFIEMQTALGRRVYITLHSTHDPQQVFGHRLGDLSKGLSKSLVIIHSDHDVGRLAELGFVNNVIQIPQGVRLLAQNRQQAGPKPELLATYGFLLPHKGLLELIEAVALIRAEGRDVKLRMVNAFHNRVDLSEEIALAARAKASSLGIADSIEMFTDYLDDAESLDLLNEGSLIVYAYQDTGESSSAAVRMGLASGVPVAVTPLKIFEDVAHVTHALPGVSPNQLAAGIIDLLDGIKAGDAAIVERATSAEMWCRSHDVGAISAHFMSIVERQAATETWYCSAEPNLKEIPTRDGQLEDGHLISNRMNGGVLAHGPYINLSNGLYRLIVRGTVREGPDGQIASLLLTKNFSADILDTFTLAPSDSDVLLDSVFSLDQPVENLECIFKYDPGSAIQLYGYSILQRVITS